MLDEVARGEIVEGDLDRLIERQAAKNDKANAEEMMWKASTRKHNDKLREARLWQRLQYHQAQLEAHTRTFEALLRRHRVGLRVCEEALGITRQEGDTAA